MELLYARSTCVENIRGKLSALIAAAIKVFFDPQGHHLQDAGVFLTLADGTRVHLFFRLGGVIADEAALHAVYACKGSSGLRPCMLCTNVYNYRNARQAPGATTETSKTTETMKSPSSPSLVPSWPHLP